MTELHRARLSADGKLLSSEPPGGVRPGDRLRLVIDGRRMVGGADHATLLGTGKSFLPHARHFELVGFAPQADGTCELEYVAR